LPIPDDYCPRESLSSITYELQLTDRDVNNIALQNAGAGANGGGGACLWYLLIALSALVACTI
jgi:hypothetical protein